MISKFIAWKMVAMDPGWGGTILVVMSGYERKEERVGGFLDPGAPFVVKIELEKVK